MKRALPASILALALAIAITALLPATAQDRLEERVANLETRVANLEQALGIDGSTSIAGSGRSDSSGSTDTLSFEGRGNQIEAFTIDEPGLYTLILTVAPSDSIFISVDVNTIGGDWIPAMSVSAIEPGVFEGASVLEAGEYYLEILSNDSWNVEIVPGAA